MHELDPMQITYYGVAYEVYTTNDGFIGCTATNNGPYEQFIYDAKSNNCGAKVDCNYK